MHKTDDIKESWLNPIRAIQAACRGNKGIAYVTVTILVDKNDAIRWTEPQLTKIHPAKITASNVNSEILSALLDMGQVDNT